MKFVKWLLLAAGASVLLFAVALAFVAATFDPNQYKTQVTEFVREKTQRTLRIEGDVRLMLFPKLGVHLGKARLSEFKSENEFASLDDMRVSLALIPLLSRQVVVDQIQLDGLHAKLVRHKDGRTNFDDLLGGNRSAGETTQAAGKSPEAAKAQMPIKLEVDGVHIGNAELSWKDEANGGNYAISDFNLKTGRIAPGVPTKFALGAAIRGHEPKLDVKLQVNGTLTADLEKQLFSVAGLTAKFNGDAAELTGLAAEFSGSMSADLKKQTARADLAMKFGESHIEAKLAIEDFALLHTTFDIAIDKFNLDPYLPQKKPTAQTSTPATAQTERAIDFSPLRKLDCTGSIRMGQLTASNIKVQNLRVDLSAKNGVLHLNPMMANLYQGTLKGSATLDANANHLATRQSLAGISIGPLLRDAIGKDIVEGHGNVALDLTSSGNLVSAMKKSLNGSSSLEIKDGALKGIDLARSLREAKGLFSGAKREAEQAAVESEKTDFSELTATFQIKNGIAHNGDLVAKSPLLRLTGAGDINIPDGSLHYLAKASAMASGAGQGASEKVDLKAVTLPVLVTGPFAALHYKLDFGSMLSDSAKQKLDDKKAEIKDKLEDKLKSKLLGRPTEPASPAAPAPDGAQPPAGQAEQPSKPQDKLKEKLKKLF